MKWVIDIPEKLAINNDKNAKTLGITMFVPATNQEIILPTNILLEPCVGPDGCKDCLYEQIEPWNTPCSTCCNAYKNLWRRK